jgi:transposase
MNDVTLIGIDLGKHSFHVHGQDRHGKALLRMKFNRKQLIEFFAKSQTCSVVMEACAGAHDMARRLAGYDHEVKLISPQFVRPFVWECKKPKQSGLRALAGVNHQNNRYER